MKLPIIIIFQGQRNWKSWPKWLQRFEPGYLTHEKVWQCGERTIVRSGEKNERGQEIIRCDYSKVKFEVYVAHWVLSLPYLPHRFANWLWRDRMADKYQAGYAAGMKEALNPANAQAFSQLNPAERAALLDLES